jgi:DNA helicase-2/ATP-dependent DNA helicase PcrA
MNRNNKENEANSFVDLAENSGSNIDDFVKNNGLAQKALQRRSQNYLTDLNEKQREAVEKVDGPLLVLAGAGTGKTRALTARIAFLIDKGYAQPNQILGVTFTNKAAQEMKQRIGKFLGSTVEGMPWLGTFHSIGAKILRRHAELIKLKTNFTILDVDDQLRLLKQLIALENVDEKRWPARNLAGLIDNWKNHAWLPDNLPQGEMSAYDGKGPKLYKLYQDRLRVLNSVDFGDLILLPIRLMQDNLDLLDKYQQNLRFILVDEYQDTNVAQYLWLRLLAEGHKNICCVGDDDQSIYGWRGAEVRNILSFEKDFPGARVVRLEQNYRSTPHILAAASSLIAANTKRLGKTLWTDSTSGEKVKLVSHWNGDEEARWLGDEIESLSIGTRGMKPYKYNEIALLVRASFQMRVFEDRFIQLGLPYRVIGGPRFYERKEIRDAIAYFRASISSDDGMAFERIINTPKRGFGEKSLQLMNMVAREHGISLMAAARIAVDRSMLPAKVSGDLDILLNNFKRWNSYFLDDTKDHTKVAETILDESGYTEMWLIEKSADAPGRLENLKELIKALSEFENIQGFLEHISLIMEMESDSNIPKVSIMTLHAAKGLEFPVVLLPGWEDGLFPSQRSMDQKGLKGLEEERRLAHVGITRAEQYCIISFATSRRIFNQWQNSIPSRFINELNEKDIEILNTGSNFGLQMSDTFSQPITSSNVGAHNQLDEFKKYDTPGWHRMQENLKKKSMTPKALDDFQPVNVSHDLDVGVRVFHQKFGYGIIESVDGDKVKVAFEKAETKDIQASFLVREEDI